MADIQSLQIKKKEGTDEKLNFLSKIGKKKRLPRTHENYNFEDLQRPETLLRVLWSEKSRQITKAYNARGVSDALPPESKSRSPKP